MQSPLNVLLIEDSEEDASLLVRELVRGGYEPHFERVQTAADMAEALRRQQWDVVVSDYVIPKFNGLDALRVLRESGLDLPFILVSGRIDLEAAIPAMKAGAHDFVRKGHLARLVPAIQRELREAAVRRGHRGAQEALQEAHRELEARVAERTAQLKKSNEFLRREIAERRRAEQERAQLVAQMVEINEKLVITGLQAKESQEAAERRVAELDAALAAVADGIIIHGPGEEIVRINPVAAGMFGLAPGEGLEAFGGRLEALQPEDLNGNPIHVEQTPTMRALRGKSTTGVIMVLDPHSENPRWISTSAAPIHGVNQSLLGAVCTFTDITLLGEMQRQREAYSHTISHDLRNPLTVIIGQAEYLKRSLSSSKSSPRQLQSSDHILRAARRMDALIEDLVESVRLEAGTLLLKRKPVDLSAMMTELLEGRALVSEWERVVTDLPASLPPVSADPERLERVILNLLANALKYSPAETRVVIRAEKKEHEVLVSVSDRGIGISRHDLRRVFDRFYRVSNKVNPGGVGLGLYITRLLVEAHGGRIWAESTPERGSTFYFTLPLLETDASEESHQEQSPEGDTPPVS